MYIMRLIPIISIIFLVIGISGCVSEDTNSSDFGVPDPTDCKSPCLDPTLSIRENIASNEDLSDCSDLSTLNEKDSCYSSFAIENQKLHYCGRIENDDQRISCFSQLSEFVNYLDCGMIINQGHMNDCYNFFTVFNNDITICQNIDNGHIGDCYIYFANMTNNSEICDRIMNIPNCYGYIGGDFPTNVCYKQNCYEELNLDPK